MDIPIAGTKRLAGCEGDRTVNANQPKKVRRRPSANTVEVAK
jgi:hypothetical protein